MGRPHAVIQDKTGTAVKLGDCFVEVFEKLESKINVVDTGPAGLCSRERI